MAGQYNQYNAWFRHHVVAAYQPGVRGHGARAVAQQFDLPTHTLVLQWAKNKSQPVESFERKHAGGRKRKLSPRAAQRYIKDFIDAKNRKGKAVSYKDVENNLHKRMRVDVSGRSIRRYGHDDFNITDKLTTRKLAIEGENSLSHPPSQLYLSLGPDTVVFDCRDEGVLGRNRRSPNSASADTYQPTSVH
jgi:hypothetical protein